MAGTIASNPAPRQTIPYGDRPFVDRAGRLTQEAYQFLNRIAGATGTTVANVTTVITTTNGLNEGYTALTNTVGTLESEVGTLEVEVAALLAGSSAPSLPTPPSGLPGSAPAPAPLAVDVAQAPFVGAPVPPDTSLAPISPGAPPAVSMPGLDQFAIAVPASPVVLTAEMFAGLDLSNLPTASPGGGRPWSNGGTLVIT